MSGDLQVFKKRGKLIFILLIAIIILSMSTAVYAQISCVGGSGLPLANACGQPITVSGNGAVELCEECYVCGVSDGVCPEVYSDGSPELKNYKKEIIMKYGSDRPSSGSTPEFRLMYNTGNDACNVIAGSCREIHSKISYTGAWGVSPIGCGADISNNILYPDYYKAVCDPVPKTSGCEFCPDPDCTTELRGLTYDGDTGEMMDDVNIYVVSDDNPNIYEQTSSTNGGEYSMQGARGYVTVLCTADEYSPVENRVYLQPGKNLVDCAMTHAICSPDCTLPDPQGTEICRKQCHEINGCFFQTDPTYGFIGEICEAIPFPTFVTLNRTNSTHVAGVDCCEGAVVTRPSPLFDPKGENVTNLITRDYRKELFGLPVTLKIMVYDKKQ